MAVNEEDFFRDFYRSAAAKTGIVSSKTLLLKLSAEEKVHKEKLQAFDFRSLNFKDDDIDLAKPLMLTPIDEFSKVKEILDFAVRSEVNARQRYAKLAKLIDDDKAKWLFNFLVVEEKRHEKLLTDEMKKLGVK